MLSANVLCIKKKKKKRSYFISNAFENGPISNDKIKSSVSGAPTMLQITEDTPPDMLAGAMDLTVLLPTGRTVKMSVERSTPMMDLLVQITTNYHLQLSGYTLQALAMSPSKDHGDTILPYKPNTPIGALDTQCIRVLPKSRNLSVPKNIPPGHQPFESTFRLKVHLPRNQLYVTRVSQGVHLDEIMKKVCEEKNLDSLKYEFRHPGNLDEVLDPKLTLSDYAITEIYLVSKGSLSQTFSTGDLMALRKEEERKQMHNKTGGGVLNLIFKRGKSSTGSLSSENRSISPTHSDDSRSVTPPQEAPPERPKPPQRKRRPAPKPPKPEPANLTICHSRNSSDSSGYHEASILSDQGNTSLPRRPKSTLISDEGFKSLPDAGRLKSKSTSNLAAPSRKKKTAPPPPPAPVLKPERTNLEEPSPVVASQPCTVAQAEALGNGQENHVANTNPKPKPRLRAKTPAPRPRSLALPSPAQEDEKTEPKLDKTDESEKIEESEEKPATEDKEDSDQEEAGFGEDLRLKQDADADDKKLAELQKQNVTEIFNTSAFFTEKTKPPEVVAMHPKANKSYFDSFTRKRGFQIGSSLLNEDNRGDLPTPSSVASALNAFDFVDEIAGVDEEMFNGSLSKSSNKSILNQLHGMHDLDKKGSSGSLRSVNSLPGFVGGNLKKWNNVEELDGISLQSGRNGWVLGDTSDTESTISTSQPTPLDSLTPVQPLPPAPESKPPPEAEADWQYHLPSPPKAFRDSSPGPPESVADSVVTSPELFEKLKVVKDQEADSTSEEILNKLSLENLEKRKSLVYNRELATSLKMSDEERKPDSFPSSLLNFEKTFQDVKKSSPKHSALPNFKITTYDRPQKVEIFEDDTVRSNETSKRNSLVESSFPLQRNSVGRSMENISFKKKDDEVKTNGDYRVFRVPLNHVFRSESFSKEQKWVPFKPVTRSKSHLVLNKSNPGHVTDTVDNLSKSNSLYDVSGLQSLEVIKSIQNKLHTPHTSTENLDKTQPEPKVQKEEKRYKYSPPSINMGTWSERPKIPVNVKEDPDYIISQSKLVVKTVNNDIKSQNSIEIRNKPTTNGVTVRVNQESSKNVIKINGFEPVSASGNVVIKIGTGRKPLSNVNSPRPHSVAFTNEFDISRVPIVRSVELKKPYKDLTSVTQIKPEPPAKPVSRVSSLHNSTVPVVRGFRNSSTESWGTLPTKPTNKNFLIGAPKPFSTTLKRVESKSVPPAPTMPKTVHTQSVDTRDQLLQAIRDFGGKKGLRAVRAS